MKNNGKKILVLLVIALLLGTSMANAQGFNYRSYPRHNGFRYNFNYKPSKPCKPTPETKPEAPAPDLPVPETKPETPAPDLPVPETKPETPAPDLPVPETKPETPAPDLPAPETKPETSSSVEMEVTRLVNIERQKAGLAPLTHNANLSKVARAKSQDMADKNYFSHNSPTYGDPFAMMRSFGIQYKTAGENIAKGYSSAQSVVKGWMNSPGHRQNILNPSFGNIGVGYVNSNGTSYWTQMFID